VRRWPRYSDFTRTLVRWLIGEDVPPGLGLRSTVVGDELRLALYVDDSLAAEVVQRPPTLVVAAQPAQGLAGEPRNIPWQRMAPGEFQARVGLPSSVWLRGAVKVGPYTLPFGPIGAIAQAEWLNIPERVEALRALAQQTGGGERLDLTEVWKAPLPPSGSDAQVWLLLAALTIFLTDALLTKLGIQAFRGWPRRAQHRSLEKRQKETVS
jgi:hypothetical protein